MRRAVLWVINLCLIVTAQGQAATTDPLRYFPADSTHLVVMVPKPKELVEAILNHSKTKEAMALPQVREVMESPGLRKFFQLVKLYEKDLGSPWPVLIDQFAGNGLVLGTKFGSNNAPALLVMSGKSEAKTQKLIEVVVYLIEDELKRNGSKETIKKKTYENIEAIELSKDLLIARIGSDVLLSNQSEALKAGIDQHVANQKNVGSKNLTATNIRKDLALLPANALASAWINLKPLKALPESKDIFASPRNEVVLTVLFAGLLDVARRSDFIVVGVNREQENFSLSVRMPAGRKDTNPDVELHLPKDPKVGGSFTPFDLPGMIACHSFYMDFDAFYSKRLQIFPAQTAKDLENGEKQISRFMINTSLPKFLAASGPHHRFVVVQPEIVSTYKKQPFSRLPAAAFVTDMRDPSFAKSMNSIIKAAGLGLSAQATLRSWEEEIEGVAAFGYSFPDEGKFPDDPQNLRFNYQPTFASVGNQFIFASNKGLCRNLIKAIKSENAKPADNANLQTVVSASGLSKLINQSPEIPLASAILSQGITLETAKARTEQLNRFLDSLGILTAKTEYFENEFRFDLNWHPKN